MATAAAGDARPIAVYGFQARLGMPIFKADGTLIITGTGSGYVSTDDGTAAAITPVFGATNSGNWIIDLTAAQMSGNKISGYITSDAVGSCPTPFVIYTKRRAAIHSGTARTAGSPTSTQIQLATTASDKDNAYVNCEVGITAGTGAGAIRRIISYTGSTRIATIGAAWGTNPSTDSVYDVMPTQEGTVVTGWRGVDIAQNAIPNVAAGSALGLPLLDATGAGVSLAPDQHVIADGVVIGPNELLQSDPEHEII